MTSRISKTRTVLLSLALLGATIATTACKSTGPQNPTISEGPDHAEMGNRAEISAELDKVFGPVDEKAEQLNQ